MRTRDNTLRYLLMLGVAAGLLPSAAFAQASQSSDRDTEVIIVTAQKKAENIQSVPIAITAIGTAALENKLVDDALDLQFQVPNLTVTGDQATLRGVGNLAISSTSESGLGYHVNGVYFNSPATEAEYFDVERIEVLRGPQGTLYGRNTTAGVLNIITKRPTADFGGDVSATIGNYETVKVKGALNIPLGDRAGVRLAGFMLKRDGYTENLFNGNRIDGRDMYGLRGSFRFDFTEQTELNLIVSHFEEDDSKSNLSKGVCTKNAATGCSALSAGFETPDSRTTIFNTLGIVTGTLPGSFASGVDYFAGSRNPTDLRQVDQDIDPTYFVREDTVTLDFRHDFGALEFNSLTSFQTIERDILNDFDRFSSSVNLLRPITFDALANGQPITTNRIISGRRDVSSAEQFLQEFRLASQFEGRFNFVAGANYYTYESDYKVYITHPTLAARQQAAGLSREFESYIIDTKPAETTSWGVFGEAYYNLTDATRLTVGARYSNDEKSILTRQIFLDPIAGGAVRPYTSAEKDWGVTTGRLGLDHRFSERLMAYGSLSRGYKAGGLNPGGPVGGASFDPEYLNAAEGGIKFTSQDGVVRANLAGFYYDYAGLQVGQVGETSALTVNADAIVMGAEVEFFVRPSPRMQFDFSMSWLDTELTDFKSGDEGDPTAIAPGSVIVRNAAGAPVTVSGGAILKNLSGNELPNSPNFKFSGGVQYRFDLGSMEITPRLDFYFQAPFYGTPFNKPSERFDGYNQTDLKIILEPKEGNWSLRAFAKNLQDNDDIVRITQEGPLVGRFRMIYVLEPRTVGLELNIRY